MKKKPSLILKHKNFNNFKKFLCGLGGLGERICFPPRGDSPPQADARGAVAPVEVTPKGVILGVLLIITVLVCSSVVAATDDETEAAKRMSIQSGLKGSE